MKTYCTAAATQYKTGECGSGWGKRNEESVKNGQGKGTGWKHGSGWWKGNERSAACHGRETWKYVIVG